MFGHFLSKTYQQVQPVTLYSYPPQMTPAFATNIMKLRIRLRNNTGDKFINNTGDKIINNTGDKIINNTGDKIINNTADKIINNK